MIIPAGKYFLGDPCYPCPNDTEGSDYWSDLLANADFFEDNEEGYYPDGTRVVAFSTKYGDGTYRDQFYNAYAVDAGLIGLTPYAFLEKFDMVEYATRLGKIVEFEKDVMAYEDDGVLHFGEYTINTNDDGTDYEDYEDNNDEEEY